MASCLMRIVLSSGKSIGKRRAICSGFQALAHRRSFRRPWRRPFHGTVGREHERRSGPRRRRQVPPPHVRFDERGVGTGATVEPLRHRQTKGTETNTLILNRHIPHLNSTAIRFPNQDDTLNTHYSLIPGTGVAHAGSSVNTSGERAASMPSGPSGVSRRWPRRLFHRRQ